MTFRGEISVLHRVQYDSKEALNKLQEDGINCAENVQQFQIKIRELIGALKKVHDDKQGKIDCQKAFLIDLISLVDEMVDYNQNPTIEKHEYLRGIALTYGGTIKEFIQKEMNKQNEKQFRFKFLTYSKRKLTTI